MGVYYTSLDDGYGRPLALALIMHWRRLLSGGRAILFSRGSYDWRRASR